MYYTNRRFNGLQIGMHSDNSSDAELDDLLSASIACLGKIKNGRFEMLEKSVAQYRHTLLNYMKDKDLKELTGQQQAKLHQLLIQQQTGIKLILSQKQKLAKKLAKLRHGRKLKNTYQNNIL